MYTVILRQVFFFLTFSASWRQVIKMLNVHYGIYNFHKSHSKKRSPLCSITIRTLFPPIAVVCSALHPEPKPPLSVSGCLLFNEVQWTAQIAWRMENSFVTRTVLSAKPDGASLWLHYLCEIGFSPRKPKDLPPPPWAIERNGQYQEENRPTLLFIILVIPISFCHLCSSPQVFACIFSPFCFWGIKIHKWNVFDMYVKFTLRIMYELWLGTAFMQMWRAKSVFEITNCC